MPCFKGLAVSIHSEGALPEFSIQKQARLSRITSYIPVPPPKLNTETGMPEQCSFSVSITLLTPGMAVPYSTPKPSDGDPFPRPQLVGQPPGASLERAGIHSERSDGTPERLMEQRARIKPYEPLTSSPNETIAAYIYFDGRKKEEVATLLRRGEETWVNSRWVSVPASEGGGLAERDFLFREVGLERWLNGLDLQGSDVAAKVQRRREKMEKRRRRREGTPSSDDERVRRKGDGILRYGADDRAPLDRPSDEDDDLMSSDSDSDDDPIPESAGQIKVALFRVLASGEIKKGEYSPQFDAHDDDDEFREDGEGADVDHTTSFAKPKTLDPKTISTQTVTGIDGPEKPFAVFTFLYRGEKQLQKMGILKSKKAAAVPVPAQTKRPSMGTDFSNLKPLQPGGTIGFTGVRETSPTRNGKGADAMDSDEDEEEKPKDREAEDKDDVKDTRHLSPEELRKHGELADGVKKIKLKRQHSFEPHSYPGTAHEPSPEHQQSPAPLQTPTISTFTPDATSPALLPNTTFDPKDAVKSADSAIIGSPLKKQRASVSGADVSLSRSSADAVAKGLGFGFMGDAPKTGAGAGELGGELPKPPETVTEEDGKEG